MLIGQSRRLTNGTSRKPAPAMTGIIQSLLRLTQLQGQAGALCKNVCSLVAQIAQAYLTLSIILYSLRSKQESQARKDGMYLEHRF